MSRPTIEGTEEQRKHPAMQCYAEIWGWRNAVEFLWPGLAAWERIKIAALIDRAE